MSEELKKSKDFDFQQKMNELKTEKDSIRNFVIDYYLNNDLTETEKGFNDRLNYINEYGCDDTLYTPLAYYEDSEKFWEKYSTEIDEKIQFIQYLKCGKKLDEIIEGYDMNDLQNEGELNKNLIANYIFKQMANNIYSRLYNTEPIQNLLKDIKEDEISPLKKRIIDILLFEENEEEIKSDMNDISNIGVKNYGMRELIYSESVEIFFDTYKSEIMEILENSKDTMGMELDELLQDYNNEDTNFETLTNKRAACYFVVEQINEDLLERVNNLEVEPVESPELEQ